MTDYLAKCSNCNRKTAALVSINAKRDASQPHFAYCWKCGKRTQTYPTAKYAIQAWNDVTSKAK